MRREMITKNGKFETDDLLSLHLLDVVCMWYDPILFGTIHPRSIINGAEERIARLKTETTVKVVTDGYEGQMVIESGSWARIVELTPRKGKLVFHFNRTKEISKFILMMVAYDDYSKYEGLEEPDLSTLPEIVTLATVAATFDDSAIAVIKIEDSKITQVVVVANDTQMRWWRIKHDS